MNLQESGLALFNMTVSTDGTDTTFTYVLKIFVAQILKKNLKKITIVTNLGKWSLKYLKAFVRETRCLLGIDSGSFMRQMKLQKSFPPIVRVINFQSRLKLTRGSFLSRCTSAFAM